MAFLQQSKYEINLFYYLDINDFKVDINDLK